MGNYNICGILRGTATAAVLAMEHSYYVMKGAFMSCRRAVNQMPTMYGLAVQQCECDP